MKTRVSPEINGRGSFNIIVNVDNYTFIYFHFTFIYNETMHESFYQEYIYLKCIFFISHNFLHDTVYGD